MSDEEKPDKILLKLTLDRAIKAYCDVIAPNEYISDWVVIAYRHSTEMENDNVSSVGIVTALDQYHVTTRGLIEEARDSIRSQVDHTKGGST